MLAPAQKNFSPWPVSTMTWTFVVEARLEDARVELLHHLVGVGVDRRVVEREDGDAAVRVRSRRGPWRPV